jgi:hypothetical protein
MSRILFLTALSLIGLTLQAQETSSKNRWVVQERPFVTDVGDPVFGQLSGYIDVRYADEAGREQVIDFTRRQGKRVKAADRVKRYEFYEDVEVDNQVDFFSANQGLRPGDRIAIRVKNNAGMYVLVQHPDGRIDFMESFGVAHTPGKPTEADVTVLPERGYAAYDGAAYAILLTRVSLNKTDLKRVLEARKGEQLHERLAAVLGTHVIQPADGNLQAAAGRIDFNATGANATVLPVVLYLDKR